MPARSEPVPHARLAIAWRWCRALAMTARVVLIYGEGARLLPDLVVTSDDRRPAPPPQLAPALLASRLTLTVASQPLETATAPPPR